jgi:hypothetical protein|tara:strand:+ start:298 stop:528 length:231 start_codon:yes stop_codon:yes gene_type:complete
MEDKMENNNELTVTFNISDSLLNALANLLLISGAPAAPAAIPPQLLAAIQGAQPSEDTEERTPIGFAPKGKVDESR